MNTIFKFDDYITESVNFDDLKKYIKNHEEDGIVYSWNIQKFDVADFEGRPCLRIRVRGMLHTGYILVVPIENSDLFEVVAITTRQTIKGRVGDVPQDDLIYVIDGMVERDPRWDDKEYEIRSERFHKGVKRDVGDSTRYNGKLKSNLDRFAKYNSY
jgi:hypothetical protein